MSNASEDLPTMMDVDDCGIHEIHLMPSAEDLAMSDWSLSEWSETEETIAELYANDKTFDDTATKTQDDPGTSIDHVFNTPSLFERILLGMHIEDLLVNAQRVSKQWKAVIDNSRRLQQALFFKPLEGGPVLWQHGPYSSAPVYGISQWDQDDKRVGYVRDWDNKDDWDNEDDWWNCYVNEEENFDDFDEKFHDFLDGSFNDNVLVQRTVVFDNPFRKQVRRLYIQRRYFAPKGSRHKFESFMRALRSDCASWRRMLICQPPLTYARAQKASPVPDRLLNFAGNKFLTWATLLVQAVDESEYKYQFPLVATKDVAIAQDVARFDHKKIDGFADWDPAKPTLTLRIIVQNCDGTEGNEVVAVGCEPEDFSIDVRQKVAKHRDCSIGRIRLRYAGKAVENHAPIRRLNYTEGTYIWATACCCYLSQW